ncbi:MAG TPA: hypothetical protein VFR33_14095 [Candidatus Dormibacteraeota bacterium]|nr:hypothetical protein [Candidatus Dormibacteraeota bacterium]
MNRLLRLAVTAAAALAVAGVGVPIGAYGAAGGWQIPGASTEVAVYANGGIYQMNIHRINLSPTSEEMAAAQPLYAVAYPINPQGLTTLGALSVQGYHPQCDPCFHPGLPLQLVYHDHVVAGVPGFGEIGTAGVWQATRHPIALMYSPAYISGPNFVPLTTAAMVQAGEAAGDFLPINPDPSASNPFEFPQPVVVTIELVPLSR